MKPETIKAIVIALIAALIFAAGWLTEGWRKDAEIARINETVAEEKQKAAEANAVALADAATLNDELTRQLNGWANTLTAFAEEKQSEIDKLVTGRPCLSGDVVRVLNRTLDKQQPRPLPQAGGLVLRPDAPAAAGADDGRYATDADVAGWIGQCQRSYDTCRGRLDAIADFYKGFSR